MTDSVKIKKSCLKSVGLSIFFPLRFLLALVLCDPIFVLKMEQLKTAVVLSDLFFVPMDCRPENFWTVGSDVGTKLKLFITNTACILSTENSTITWRFPFLRFSVKENLCLNRCIYITIISSIFIKPKIYRIVIELQYMELIYIMF